MLCNVRLRPSCWNVSIHFADMFLFAIQNSFYSINPTDYVLGSVCVTLFMYIVVLDQCHALISFQATYTTPQLYCC